MFFVSPILGIEKVYVIRLFPCRIGMARMDTVDLSSGSEVYTPDVEEVNLLLSPACV